MSLTVYTLEESEQWDGVVRSFKDYDVYWLSGYVKAFQIHGDGEPLLFCYEDKDVRGINVVMKRDVAMDGHFAGKIPEGQYYDLTTPYGYGGWLIEGDETEKLFKVYSDWLGKNGIISEFVRFHPMIKNHEFCGNFYDVVRLGEVVHMDLTSPEVIWDGLTSKNRNHIKKAIKSNIKIYNGRYPAIFNQFRKIYDETMKLDHAKEYYYFNEKFYDSVLEDLSENAQIFYAEKDGTVIAASVMLCANGRMNYHLSGSLRKFSCFAPTNLLLYKAALWGHANGYKTLYLGGGVGSGEDSLFKFKRSFYRGKLHYFYIGKKIYDAEKYHMLVDVRGEMESSFFPLYRAMAD